jgi:hypothetical protein
MFTGKLVFAQLMDFLPLHTFRRTEWSLLALLVFELVALVPSFTVVLTVGRRTPSSPCTQLGRRTLEPPRYRLGKPRRGASADRTDKVPSRCRGLWRAALS